MGVLKITSGVIHGFVKLQLNLNLNHIYIQRRMTKMVKGLEGKI